MLKLVTLFAAFILPFISGGCPPAEELRRCKCIGVTTREGNVRCRGLKNWQDYMESMHAYKFRSEHYYLSIEKCHFDYFPRGIFNDTRFVELKIHDSLFPSLTDVAFEGLEDSLRTLIISNTKFVKSWNWAVLKNLKNITDLRVSAGLNNISGDIETLKPTNLMKLDLANNYIKRVHDTAFSSFKSLTYLSLSNNAIMEVKRSMLPNPAYSLKELDLDYNDLHGLPADMFSNMPSLEVLSLNFNGLLSIDEKPFSDVWNQLKMLSVEDNRIMCDCRVKWVLKQKKPRYFSADCDQPQDLKGKKLKDMTEKDLKWC